ncbi:hypothetical protein GLOIN_2v1773059 [Rhizophagus clarus]|uniref:Uncharacterized protein n=1 Tax=Rhizophagus clarus TaxID=94130 RepID=A0A8H3L611_9GLOM|nr:hypothetical protein GLOIN_2v1773059 [Rhizophagus clarus]
MGLYVLCEFVLPFVLYYILRTYIREVWALLVSSAPPFIIVIYGIISKRRIDVTGVLLIIGLIVSAVVSLLKDDPRIQLLRNVWLTEVEPTEERWDRHWVSYQYFRRGFIIMTAIWGFGLIYQIPIRVIIIYKLSTDQAFLFVNVLEYFSAIMMGLLTPICAWLMKKQSNKIADKDATASI